MSQEKVLKILESIGLGKIEAQVYILLAKRGPQRAKDIAQLLKTRRQRIYAALKSLEGKGIVSATLEAPARFSVLALEEALDLFVKAKTEEAKRIENAKEELSSVWQSVSMTEAADKVSKFSVIEGRRNVFPRLKQMIEQTESELLTVTTVSDLIRADQFGLLEAAFSHALRTKTKFRFITELSIQNLRAMKLLLERMPRNSGFGCRTPELGMRLISRMLIRDNTEAAFFVSRNIGTSTEADDLCLWTNCSAIVNSFKTVFEDLWHNSIEIEKRIAAIESGRPTPVTQVITDPAAAKKKYDELIAAAQTEILMLTSEAGLVEAWKKFARLEEFVKKSLSIRIMAPITKGNLEVALKFSEYGKVKHVAAGHLEIIVADGKHLFQLKPPLSNIERLEEPSSFENTFYTNDLEYVEKTKNTLEEIWKHAVAPSGVTFGEIKKSPIPFVAPVLDDEYTVSKKDSAYQKMVIHIEEKPGIITEEYVLNKLINAKRIAVKDLAKDPARFYGSTASAAIHPPSNFNLPDMIISFFNCNKKSSWGAEDWMTVYLLLETPNGKAFVPVANAGDNPKGVERRKLSMAGTPASKNQHLLKKDELQIHVHGNTLFAGWTAPIPLFPPPYSLPPGAILFEGYGKLKPLVSTITMPSGAVVIHEANALEAFVTFFHPASKYAGPGTDGVMARDLIMTGYPPPIQVPTKQSE